MADIQLTHPDLHDAATLLAKALGGSVELNAVTGPDDRQSRTLLIEVRWRPDTGGSRTVPSSARLRLTPHEPAAEPGARPGTVWVLRRASPALRQSLRDRGLSFVDLAGAVHVRLPWLMVDRADLPRRRVATTIPSVVNPFGDHNSRVVRLLLDTDMRQATPKRWGVRELAAASTVDRTTTSKILRRLAAWRLVRLERRGRAVAAMLTDPLQLIDRWSATYDWSANPALAVHAPIGDPQRFLRRLPSSFPKHRRWALTLQAGASLLAPHAMWHRVHVYVDVDDTRDLAAVADHAGWSVGTDGNLVLLKPLYRTTVWEHLQAVGDLPVVSLIQLIVDLWQYPVSGREQAEHLFELRRRLMGKGPPQ